MGKIRKVAALALGITISASVAQPAWAAPEQDIHNEQSRLKQVQEKKEDAANEVANLKEEIAEAQKKINESKAAGKKTQEKIDKLKKKIIETQKRVERRKKLLAERVQVMYKEGGAVSYIEVLLGSQDFSDFISRALALNTIAEQDKELLEKQKADKRKLESAKEEIRKSLDRLQKQIDSVSELKAELEEKKQKKLAVVDNLEKEENDIKEKMKTESEQKDTKSSSDDDNNGSQKSQSSDRNQSSGQSVSYSGGAASGSVQDLVQAGRKYIGNSIYQLGGGRTQADIRNGVFDCSGFVHWAFQQIGVSVGSTTSTLQNAGHAVDPSNMKPGDLVFFDTNGRNGHVGIYIGGGRFIGSQSSTGVAIVSMSNSYWSSHFSGYVRRVL